jgi:hypothetical protein
MLFGGAIALALSIALSRVMESALLGIATRDARVFAGFAIVLVAAALLAGYLPARRAAAFDPMIRCARNELGADQRLSADSPRIRRSSMSMATALWPPCGTMMSA